MIAVVDPWNREVPVNGQHIDPTGIVLLMLLGIVSYAFYRNVRLGAAVVGAVTVVGFIMVLMGSK